MITQPDDLSRLIDCLSRSTWTLAAIGMFFESGLAEQLREPRTIDELAARFTALTRARIERCLAVVEMEGIVSRSGDSYQLAPSVPPYTEAPMLPALCGDVRSALMQGAAYLDGARSVSGRAWRHTVPALLEAQGDASSLFASGFANRLVHGLGDLRERLDRSTASFLDVGVGVGALSISMCRHFPQLRVLGVDVLEESLSLARARVEREGLAARIELQQLPVQELNLDASFDFAWLPAVFMSPSEIPAAIARTRAALRRGGWLLMPALAPRIPEDERAVWSLVLESLGAMLDAESVQALLVDAGFASSRIEATPSWAAIVCAQR